MNEALYSPLRLREIFHLEFLRWLSKKIRTDFYVLKGGVNLRFFFKNIRYSEDMDLDIRSIEVEKLKEIVMNILNSSLFQNNLRVFGIEKVISPDIIKAKQTQTTQRFKIHLITTRGEDLFTKIEFSRRGFKGEISIEPVPEYILREYKITPVIVPHYDIYSMVIQKIEAIARRNIVQARDIFDLYVLSSQYDESADKRKVKLSKSTLAVAQERVFEVSFEEFKDTVISYFSSEDKKIYDSSSLWDEIRLRVSNFIESFGDI